MKDYFTGPGAIAFRIFPVILAVMIGYSCSADHDPARPNVILIMTDDQGIGDLGCHGNPWLKTPELDDFYSQSVRLTDFHVSPVCTPTRSAIITGKYPIRNGAWATYKGRDIITRHNPTLAEVFSANGYATGMFGKWHLGDNYPARPTDCGFDLAVHHKAGGVGELSDYWGNNYFDDTYVVNNKPQEFSGYCTDVWFREAMRFIEANRDNPFFVYLPTNAPHGPHYVDEKYAEPYLDGEGKLFPNANFYGMLANIDENFGKLEDFLEEQGLAQNTILIFMTDNGSGGGMSNDGKLGWNHGFRGKKGGKVEGGHRVPFLIRWPAGGIQGGKDLNDLTAHVDIYPTLAGLCDLEVPAEADLDGHDLSPLLLDGGSLPQDRIVFVHHNQDWRPPDGVEGSCIAQGKWRLVNGVELYDVNADRAQKNNIADRHPEIVKELLEKNRVFLDEARSREEYKIFPAATVGTEAQEVIVLNVQHSIGDDRPIWKAEHVARGDRISNSRHELDVASPGNYLISCARWPRECPGPVWGVPGRNPKGLYDYKTIHPEKVRMAIGEQVLEKVVSRDDMEVVFEVQLEEGRVSLELDFIEGGEKYSVYYAYVEKSK